MRACVAFLLGASFFSLSFAAEANGRYPYGNQLIVHPRNPDILLERTTFGILISEDHGGIFHWLCEPLIGFTNNLDPGVAIFEDGSYAVAGIYGLAISRDNACSFQFQGGGLKDEYVVDIALDPRKPSGGVVVTNTQRQDGTTHVQVFQTSDNGMTWAESGPSLPPDLIATTLDVAPSDPQRVYVAGYYFGDDGQHGFVQRSNDRGKTWGPRITLGGSTVEDRVTSAFISGVDPNDPDRVFVRTFDPKRYDTLLVSGDGFATYKVAKKFNGSMLGFAIAPDGSQVAIGGAADGVHVAQKPAAGLDYAFEQHSVTPVNCLKWTSETLYACGFNQTPGVFVLGRSNDQARNWTPVLQHVNDIKATLTRCPANSQYNNLCIPDWRRQACLFAKPGALEQCAAETGAAPSSDDGGSCASSPLSGPAPKAATGIAAVVFALGLALRRRRKR